MELNPDEVEEIKYVDYGELKEMMDWKSGLKWSPWFRIIVDNFLENWWLHLDEIFKQNKFMDTKTIHRFNI